MPFVRDVSPLLLLHEVCWAGTGMLIEAITDLKTPMTEQIYKDDETREGINAMTPWGEWGNVEDVARCAVFLASEDANYITGVPLVIDGGYTAQ